MAIASDIYIKDEPTVKLVTEVQELWGLPTTVGAARAIILDHPLIRKLRRKYQRTGRSASRRRKAGA